MSKNEIEKKEPAQLPSALVNDMQADAGQGAITRGDKESFALPFLSILQGLSAQCRTVEGAKPGLFINTITEELYAEAYVIPCHYQRQYTQWAPDNGPFRGVHDPISIDTGEVETYRNDKNQLCLKGTNDILKDTRNFFVLVRSETGAWQPAILSLSSTQIKKAKRWMSIIQGSEIQNEQGKSFNPPSYAYVYKLTTAQESNDHGTWDGVVIEQEALVSEPELYAKAKIFSEQACDGIAVATEPTEEKSDKL